MAIASLLSAPETDAGILAVPDRLYGSGPQSVLSTEAEIPEISGTPRPERYL